MSPQEFKKARETLGLSAAQLGKILNTDPRTVRRWEADENDKSSRPPNPIACRVIEWMIDGYRPPEWPHADQ